MFPPGASEHLLGLGLATSSSDFQTCDSFFFPLCRFPKGKTEVSLNWAFVQWMKLLLEHRPLTRRSVNIWGVFYSTREDFPVSWQPAACVGIPGKARTQLD